MLAGIADAIDPRHGETLVEIGPGQAALTDVLLARVPRIAAIEIDRDLAAVLRRRLGEERLVLLQQDALATDYRELAAHLKADSGIRVVGNLPYNISSPLLVHLATFRDRIIDQHFMLQKEVVDRICAAPGGSDYGRLGVLLQACYQVESLFDVPPSAFDPPPRVMSSVIRMSPLADGPDAALLAALQKVLSRAFAQRRKMMRKTLIPWLESMQVDVAALEPTARPEEVPVAVYLDLARGLRQSGSV